jgi:hypothetical protein
VDYRWFQPVSPSLDVQLLWQYLQILMLLVAIDVHQTISEINFNFENIFGKTKQFI